jgi:glycosyltransferase involved in cell wall biosynthesis
VLFELALISKAFAMHKKFDLYHTNFGDGELILPFARFIKKPILVTMHGPMTYQYQKKIFGLYKDIKNVYFVSISNSQRKPIPGINYIKTIHHGIDAKKAWQFNPVGDKQIIWTGRAVPDKGLDIVLSVLKRVKKQAKLFPIIKEEYLHWLHEEIIKKRNLIYQAAKIYIDFDVNRSELNHQYQTSKLFLFPLQWEEPFGLTLIESMACGTPVIAYARGSVPEIVKDGETGFLVNPSDTDIRGNFIIKKTGIDGLCEAVEKIYSLPEEEYKKMRLACRTHVENHFTVERMVDDYINVYEEILSKKH